MKHRHKIRRMRTTFGIDRKYLVTHDDADGGSWELSSKDVNGVYSVYTLAQLEQIALEIAAQVIPLYEQESDLVAQVDAATTIEEVELIGFV